jgi:chromosome partitioning protein
VASRLNNQLHLSGIVLCMYDSNTRLAIEVGQDVEEFFRNAKDQNKAWSAAQMFQSRIRRNIRLAEAPSFGQSIFQYAADSNGAEDYRKLAAEVIAQGKALETGNQG